MAAPSTSHRDTVVKKTVETPRIQIIDRIVDVLVMAQRQVLSGQRVQNTVEVPQIEVGRRGCGELAQSGFDTSCRRPVMPQEEGFRHNPVSARDRHENSRS